MTLVLDKFAMLDPARAERQIEIAHDGPVLDHFALLDPARAARQLESVLGITVDKYALLDPERLTSLVEAAFDEEEGGGDWWDDDAVVDIDLVNNRAWTEADGEVAIDTLLGTDANTDNYWDNSVYNPEALTVDGLVGYDTVALIGAARTAALGGTIRVQTKQLADTNSAFNPIILMAADGNNGAAVEIRFNPPDAWFGFDGDESDAATISRIVNELVADGGAVNVIAATLTNTRAEFSANGSDAESAPVSASYWPDENPFVAVAFQVNDDNAMQTITIYDALPSTAGLSELSETDVTNTAPIISYTWGDHATDGEMTVEDINYATGGYAIIDLVASSDPEGNPVTFSITGPSASDYTADGRYVFAAEGATFTSGDYTFTVRATDPGGLYVEQEFTITVTE